MGYDPQERRFAPCLENAHIARNRHEIGENKEWSTTSRSGVSLLALRIRTSRANAMKSGKSENGIRPLGAAVYVFPREVAFLPKRRSGARAGGRMRARASVRARTRAESRRLARMLAYAHLLAPLPRFQCQVSKLANSHSAAWSSGMILA